MSCGSSMMIRTAYALEEVHMPPDKQGLSFLFQAHLLWNNHPLLLRNHAGLKREPGLAENNDHKDS